VVRDLERAANAFAIEKMATEGFGLRPARSEMGPPPAGVVVFARENRYLEVRVSVSEFGSVHPGLRVAISASENGTHGRPGCHFRDRKRAPRARGDRFLVRK
jgi:hypothetical protein